MLRYLIPIALLSAPLSAEVPKVVTDIAPIHSLVAQVMAGVGEPDIVVPSGVSPHHHAMRPSEARALNEADLVIWVGHGLTPWLEEPVETLAKEATVVELTEVEGIELLSFREGALFEVGDDGHDHDHGHEDGDGVADPHVWLNPNNAALFINVIAAELTQMDPDNAETYAQNARNGIAEINALDGEIEAQMSDLRGIPFVVLHDGFHYFEAHYEIEAIAAISAGDAQTPGATRVRALRDALQENPPRCAFSEPQVGTRLVDTVTEGLDVKVGVLDPLGADYLLGPTLYTQMLTSMADSFKSCLSE